jgi:hypothetical protein
MNYISSAEHAQYGLDPATPESWIGAASALIDAHCRRPSLAITQYVERMRIDPHRNLAQLTYLPLTPVAPATSAIVAIRARYSRSQLRKGDVVNDLVADVALAFSLAGTWIDIDPTLVDFDAATGQLVLPVNALTLTYNEVEITYTAGLDAIPDAVKFACAQIVKNTQATPGLNVKSGRLDRMKMEYFADSLLDESVRKMLAPYVSQRMG